MIDKFSIQYPECLATLERRVAEPAPALIQILVGPRQVGKTTLLLALQRRLGGISVYAAGDSPEGVLPGFWERLWADAERIVGAQGRAIVLLDEVQQIRGWPQLLKGVWDRYRRLGTPINIVASGSSALHLAAGGRESLAGRFERLTLAHWTAVSLAREFGLAPEIAAEAAVRFGTYPGAFKLREDPARFLAYVRDAIVEPAIGRDLLSLEQIRRPALLRQVFALAAAMPATIVALHKLQGQLQDRGALETIAHYLALLDQAYLVAPIEKYSTVAIRRRAAPSKLVVLNNALLAAGDPRGMPDRHTDPARFGTWVENACLAHALALGYRVTYWREEPLEVDALVEGEREKWAVEIKTSRYVAADLRGVFEFARRNPDFRPAVLCEPADRGIAEAAGAIAQDWRHFLALPPASASRP